jgi:2-polyprenyl-3-methyl-5-hydroxy-6-metoxy-1,4-benzoquinol methylase
MTNQALEAERPTISPTTIEIYEIRKYPSEWIMPWQSIRRYEEPSVDTSSPLEYAFYLLGDLAGKTVVDLGCNKGLNSVILASLGAKVISLDGSDANLALTEDRARVNGVERNLTLRQMRGARIPLDEGQADRVLCTGSLSGFDCVDLARQIRRVLKPGGAAAFVQPLKRLAWFSKQALTLQIVAGISRAVGRPGRCREFARRFRSLLVWEARKER